VEADAEEEEVSEAVAEEDAEDHHLHHHHHHAVEDAEEEAASEEAVEEDAEDPHHHHHHPHVAEEPQSEEDVEEAAAAATRSLHPHHHNHKVTLKAQLAAVMLKDHPVEVMLKALLEEVTNLDLVLVQLVEVMLHPEETHTPDANKCSIGPNSFRHSNTRVRFIGRFLAGLAQQTNLVFLHLFPLIIFCFVFPSLVVPSPFSTTHVCTFSMMMLA
jgi:hypothetical protein